MKPTIPREVADAIESFRADGWDNPRIILISLKNGFPITPRATVLVTYAHDNVDTLLAALVNGYDVEKTEEERAHERIRDWYAGLQKIQRNCQQSLSLRDMAFARADTIRCVLNDLGIKIPEVNA